MLFRLALLALVFYGTSKLLALFFKPSRPSETVQGKSKSKPLNVSDNEIQDVDFKEVDE
ncbi:MAG TPA: hypothetical protein PKN04_03815 [bacterium]|nr:hypothetical protein [bacterium]HNT64884.1 hypothetical protein [bacterium]HOX84948.1 hypothetical protein [bacterium]HPG44186.1 hypothetical protein [bacterium]HPM96553.1 hypothetical protein [bacterium]